MPVIAFPDQSVVHFPDWLSSDELSKAAATAWSQLKDVASRADQAIDTALAPNPQNYSSVARTQIEVPKTLGREVYSGVKSVAEAPAALYHAATDPETAEESQRFGKGFETKIGPAGRLIDRSIVQPTLNAIEDYSSGKVSSEDALSVAPEAIGPSAVQTLVGSAVHKAIGGKPTVVTESAAPAEAASFPAATEPALPQSPTTPIPSTATAEGANFSNSLFQQVKTEHPDWTLSKQLQEAGQRESDARRMAGGTAPLPDETASTAPAPTEASSDEPHKSIGGSDGYLRGRHMEWDSPTKSVLPENAPAEPTAPEEAKTRSYKQRIVKPSVLPEADVARLTWNVNELDRLLEGDPAVKKIREVKAQIPSMLQDIRGEQQGVRRLINSMRGDPNIADDSPELKTQLDRMQELKDKRQQLTSLYLRTPAKLGDVQKPYIGNLYPDPRLRPNLTEEGRASVAQKTQARIDQAHDNIRTLLRTETDPARRTMLQRQLNDDVVVKMGKGTRPDIAKYPDGTIGIETPEITLKVVQQLNKTVGDGRFITDLASLVPDAERESVRHLKQTDPVAYRQAVQQAARNWAKGLRDNVNSQLEAAKSRVQRDVGATRSRKAQKAAIRETGKIIDARREERQ